METTTIENLFGHFSRKFKIPAYQRAYSWDKENILQFIEDLKDAKEEYYLGHFLFEEDESPNTLLVIDGQQRLTTCVIFFSVLLQELTRSKTCGATVAINIAEIEHVFLRDLVMKTQRFETVTDDNNFFVDEIITPGRIICQQAITASQQRIRAAKDVFSKTCSIGQNVTVSELQRWYQLVSTAHCTSLTVKGKEKAARIFAFQNDRGKELSRFETLKSFFLLQLYLHSSGEPLAEHLKYLENEISSIYHQVVRIRLKEDEVLLNYWRTCIESNGFDSVDVIKEVKQVLRNMEDGESICSWIRNFAG